MCGGRFAFIEFDTEEEAVSAIKDHNDEAVDGRELHVSLADSSSKSTPNKPTPQKSFRLYSSSQLHSVHCTN